MTAPLMRESNALPETSLSTLYRTIAETTKELPRSTSHHSAAPLSVLENVQRLPSFAYAAENGPKGCRPPQNTFDASTHVLDCVATPASATFTPPETTTSSPKLRYMDERDTRTYRTGAHRDTDTLAV